MNLQSYFWRVYQNLDFRKSILLVVFSNTDMFDGLGGGMIFNLYS